MRQQHPSPRLRARSIAAICLIALAPCAATAQTPPSDEGKVTRLTPEERAELLDAGIEASADRAQAQAMGGGYERQIHGEVGAMIGTGGARGIFGTAVIPLGETGTAIISFEKSSFGRHYDR